MPACMQRHCLIGDNGALGGGAALAAALVAARVAALAATRRKKTRSHRPHLARWGSQRVLAPLPDAPACQRTRLRRFRESSLPSRPCGVPSPPPCLPHLLPHPPPRPPRRDRRSLRLIRRLPAASRRLRNLLRRARRRPRRSGRGGRPRPQNRGGVRAAALRGAREGRPQHRSHSSASSGAWPSRTRRPMRRTRTRTRRSFSSKRSPHTDAPDRALSIWCVGPRSMGKKNPSRLGSSWRM